MSTKVSDFLYELIQSLTKSEKRYFKLLSSRHTIGEENNYVLLFDFLEKQETYDEDLVFKYFKGESFLNRFSITKKRLYNHILSALDSFHAQASTEAQLHKMLHSADILIHKALYAQASKLLKSAAKLATKNELHNIRIDIRKKIKLLSEKDNYLNVSNEDLSTTLAEDETLHQQSLYEDQMWHIKSKLLQLMSQQGQVRSTENEKAFTEIYHEFQGIKRPESPSIEAQYLNFHIESAYQFALQNYQKSYDEFCKNLNLFHENNLLIEKHPERYFSLLTNMVYTADYLENFDEADQHLDALRQFEQTISATSNDDLKVKLFSTLSSINLTFAIKRAKFTDAIEIVPNVTEGLERFSSKLSGARKAFLNFKIASILLSTGDTSGSLKAIRNILNDSSLDKKEDIVSFALLLELFIHIEMEDLDYLSYACKSTLRFLKKRNRLYPFEEAIIRFTQKYANITNKFDGVEKWEELHTKLVELSEDPFQASALEYFDFISWAESKAKEESFLKIYKANFSTKMKNAG